MSEGAHLANCGPLLTRCRWSAFATIQSPLLTSPTGSADVFSRIRTVDRNFLIGSLNVSAPASYTKYSSIESLAVLDSLLGGGVLLH